MEHLPEILVTGIIVALVVAGLFIDINRRRP